MKKWQCTVCGYIHNGDSPPDKCPVCGADKSLFVPYQEETSGPLKVADAPTAGHAANIATQWRCSVCGYVHSGSEPPEKCPVCGADRTLFVPVTKAPPEAFSSSDGAPEKLDTVARQPEPKTDRAGFKPPWAKNERLGAMAQLLTQLHGHPIAVHIPNGLLPVAVLFGLIALLFGSESFAIAARYNMVLVSLAMPIVIATGLVDWVNRFGGHMTPIFKNKMVCAGVVTLLSVSLAIWWIANPDIYQNGFFANWFFILLHLVDLAAAGLAGWYGGKLVFNK